MNQEKPYKNSSGIFHEISKPKIIAYKAIYSKQEFDQISHGLRPSCMEDKWYMFLENMTLFIHRSWTGHCIYKIVFESKNNEYVIKETYVNRDPNQYNASDDQYDISLINFLINNLLLGKSIPFPMPSYIKKQDKSLYHHVVAGIGYKKEKINKKPWWKLW